MEKSTDGLLLVGTAETCPDLAYLSGFRAVDPVVMFQGCGAMHLVVPRIEHGRAMRAVSEHRRGSIRDAAIRVWTPEDLGVPEGRRRRVEEWAARLVRMLGVRKVRVTGTFPHGIAVRLVGAGVRVRLMRGPAVEDRSIKTAAELAKIRDAQQAAVIAMRVAVRTIAAAAIGRDGALRSGGSVLTSERVRRLIAQVLLEHDCWCRDTIVACGAQSVDPHEVGSGPLRAREPIVIDIFPQHMEHGYWGDLTRTVLRGEAPAGVRQAYLAVRAGQNAALARIRPGVACRSVHREAVAAMQGRGFRTGKEHGRPVGFIHGTGHGVGLEVHEAPALGLGEGRLRRGHVVTVEPGLYYPGIGGIRIEDTVVVTRSGWSYLVPCEKRLEV